jgi:small-conductance mechanosensitive channel
MRLGDLLSHHWYGGSVRTWLLALGVAVGLSALLLATRGLVARRLERVASRTPNPFDDLAVTLVRRTRAYAIVALSLAAAAQLLALPVRAELYLGRFAKVVFLLQLGVWGSAIIAFWVQRYVDQRVPGQTAGRGSAAALNFFGRIVLWAFVIVLVLEALGYSPRALVTGLGIGGIAVALAAQNVLGDLFAALAIYLDKPFVVGDSITVDGFQGTVEHIGLKTTRVRSVSGEQIVFSNAELLKKVLRNYRRLYERRAFFTVDVVYETPPETAARIPALIRDAVEAQGVIVRFGRSHLAALTDSALRFETEYFVLDPDYGKFMDTQQAVYLAVLAKFRAEGIDFAHPTRTIRHEGPVAATTDS